MDIKLKILSPVNRRGMPPFDKWWWWDSESERWEHPTMTRVLDAGCGEVVENVMLALGLAPLPWAMRA